MAKMRAMVVRQRSEPLTVNSLDLIGKRARACVARDSEDTSNFSLRSNVASMNEIYPFEKAQKLTSAC